MRTERSGINIRGEVFHVGDIVAQYPDVPETIKDRGEIVAVGECGPCSVTVRWKGISAEDAHIDRIAIVELGIFS
jgi:hypothetical protein